MTVFSIPSLIQRTRWIGVASCAVRPRGTRLLSPKGSAPQLHRVFIFILANLHLGQGVRGQGLQGCVRGDPRTFGSCNSRVVFMARLSTVLIACGNLPPLGDFLDRIPLITCPTDEERHRPNEASHLDHRTTINRTLQRHTVLHLSQTDGHGPETWNFQSGVPCGVVNFLEVSSHSNVTQPLTATPWATLCVAAPCKLSHPILAMARRAATAAGVNPAAAAAVQPVDPTFLLGVGPTERPHHGGLPRAIAACYVFREQKYSSPCLCRPPWPACGRCTTTSRASPQTADNIR